MGDTSHRPAEYLAGVRWHGELDPRSFGNTGNISLGYWDHQPESCESLDADHRYGDTGTSGRSNQRARMNISLRHHAVEGGFNSQVPLNLGNSSKRLLGRVGAFRGSSDTGTVTFRSLLGNDEVVA